MEVFPECEISVGDIITTRNAKPSENITPGFWNHAAIVGSYKGRLCVVEVQYRFPEVVAFTPNCFFRRYPRVRAGWCYYGPEMANFAVKQIGRPINYTIKQPSKHDLTPEIKNENCVSFLRRCAFNVISADVGWQVPDDVVEKTFLRWEWLTEDWTPPASKWAGRIHKL